MRRRALSRSGRAWRGSLAPRGYRCDACGERFAGEPAGHGLLLFVRGDRVVREEPPLCPRCAVAVEAAAYRWWDELDG